MKLLTVEAVAEVLCCAKSTVYELVALGKLAGFRIGPRRGGVRISEDDLLAYLESCRQGPPEQKPRQRTPKLRYIRLS